MKKISLRRLAAKLPTRWENELKRLHFHRLIHKGAFFSDEPEFNVLHTFVQPGNLVIDIGANVGFYSKRLAELVGPQGRVLAFEPVAETFMLLASNLESCGMRN